MRMYVLALAAAGLAVIGATRASAAPADEPTVGGPAPAFSLPGSDGRVYSLADFAGKQAVVIAWFPKAFTGG